MKTGAFPIAIFVEDQIVDPFGTGDIYIYMNIHPHIYIHTYVWIYISIHMDISCFVRFVKTFSEPIDRGSVRGAKV